MAGFDCARWFSIGVIVRWFGRFLLYLSSNGASRGRGHAVSLPLSFYMTYSLNTLNASSGGKSAPRSWAARFSHEIILLVGLLALVFWLLALLSYTPQHAALSTTGTDDGHSVTNWLGRL